MSEPTCEGPVGIGLIGVGGIAELVHYPGVQAAPGAAVVAMLDTDRELLARRQRDWPAVAAYSELDAFLAHPGLDAVIIATPNHTHPELALAAIRAGKHVLCEKPLALNAADAARMYEAAEQAGVRHMTAFTYRFSPGIRYLRHLIERGDLGEPRHFRAQRFQDWPDHCLGWRQWRRMAGSGELGDMASHRIDYGRLFVGEVARVCGLLKQYERRDRDEQGRACEPADTDDWVAVIIEFESGATGVIESTKLARGHGSGTSSHEHVEVNGTEASAIYRLARPYELLVGRRGGRFERIEVPAEFRRWPGSSRPIEGDPAVVWRYDQACEFVAAIRQRRPCWPSFLDGLRCQQIMDAIIRSAGEGTWVPVANG
jgi:predicted dehydrogenase